MQAVNQELAGSVGDPGTGLDFLTSEHYWAAFIGMNMGPPPTRCPKNIFTQQHRVAELSMFTWVAHLDQKSMFNSALEKACRTSCAEILSKGKAKWNRINILPLNIRSHAFHKEFSVLYYAKVQVIKWSILGLLLLSVWVQLLGSNILTIPDTVEHRDHIKSSDRPSLKLDGPSGLSCVLASFSPMGLCLWGSSLPGEPSCQDTERDHQPTKRQHRRRKSRFYFDISVCDTHYTSFKACWQPACHAFCDILTEGEQESGGVNCRASSWWFPDQSREGDVLGGSALVMTPPPPPPPPPDSSCSTLTPTPLLTSPPERRCSAGGLGSTILLKDKCSL